MNWIKLLVQRRILAAVIEMVTGIFGATVAPDGVSQFVNALVTFFPAILNVWSYAKKIDSTVLDRSLAAGIIPIVALVFKQLGVDIPDETLNSAYASGAVLVAAVLSLASRFSKNPIQPTGALASPNP